VRQERPTGGSVIVDAVGIAVVVFVALTATLHVWGRGLSWLIRRSAKNIAIVEALLVSRTSRMPGQGQTRPPGR
jgi:hypothetical protein